MKEWNWEQTRINKKMNFESFNIGRAPYSYDDEQKQIMKQQKMRDEQRAKRLALPYWYESRNEDEEEEKKFQEKIKNIEPVEKFQEIIKIIEQVECLQREERWQKEAENRQKIDKRFQFGLFLVIATIFVCYFYFDIPLGTIFCFIMRILAEISKNNNDNYVVF
eukprot:c25668_g1_i1.p1 GENE.c25668_g1_i1~~c25668_g1_i1.p1  ORF type:complete len:164 (+),score=27.63 c25668_g1_i1:42-533(+)